MRGVAANVEAPNLNEPGCPINVSYEGKGIDGMTFTAPDSDSA
jgi:hypothetical protein